MDRHVYRDLGKNTVNYDRDPLLFFPYVSLPSELCPPDQTPFEAIKEIFQKAVKIGLYDETSEKWAIIANDSEKEVPKFFNKVRVILPGHRICRRPIDHRKNRFL